MSTQKLATSPWGFRETPLAEQCKWLQDQGLSYICGQSTDEFAGTFKPDITDAEIAEANALVQAHGLRFASFNAGGDFMVSDDVAGQIATCCKDIDLAAKFKPELIIVFVGWQDREDDAVYEQVSSSLKQVARHAAKYNLTVAVETHGGLMSTGAQCNRLIAGADEPNLGINYDPANFALYSGTDPLAELKATDVPVVFTHFKSMRHENGTKKFCRLADGELDYVPILQTLKDRGYDGIYAIEYEEPSDVFEGSTDDLNELKRLLAAVT